MRDLNGERQGEFNPAPTTSPAVSSERLAKLYQRAREIIELAECSFALQPSIVIDLKGEFPRDVFEIGCMPDFDGYTKTQNKVTVDARKFAKRFAGGHISMSHKSLQSFDDAIKFVPWLDSLVGCYSTYAQHDVDGARARREIYGKAGAFRWKNHNKILEYRTPDNGIATPAFRPSSRKTPFVMEKWQTALQLVQQAIVRYNKGLEVPQTLLSKAIKSINSCDRDSSYEVLTSALGIQ